MVAKIAAGVGPQYPQVLVLVGATGDLARRKLLPGLFHLSSSGFIPGCRIIGVSLDEMDSDGFRQFARDSLTEFSTRKVAQADWDTFAKDLQYMPLTAGAAVLRAAVLEAERSLNVECRRLHYLSVPPNAALSAVRLLGEADLVDRSRIIIDHVQIDVPEKLGLGKRSGFYEQTGAYRDMVVTHLFQILGFTAMEAPTSLEPKPISEEKNKVFRSLLPIKPSDVIRGQYRGYRSEEGVSGDSDTETFIALRCHIDNWRWAGVPFYLRTGKRLAQGQRIISIAFR